jgi:heat shock protein HtpX
MQRISFHDQIARNKRKSIFLIAIIFIVIVLLGYVIALIYTDFFWVIIMAATVFSIIYVVAGYYNSDSIALASVNAKIANQPEHRQYHNIVEGLCLASGMPKPKLYVMENDQINAFATGEDPKHSVICVTTGALKKLDKQELEGVIGHELSHIANYDIRFMTLVAVLVGMIALISQIFLRSLWFSGGGGNKKDNAWILLIGIALAILAPIVVSLVQLAISRKREFVADASAVKFIRTPTGLIKALKKIQQENPDPKSKKQVNKALAPLFISNPFSSKGLGSTHPSLSKRISLLERM